MLSWNSWLSWLLTCSYSSEIWPSCWIFSWASNWIEHKLWVEFSFWIPPAIFWYSPVWVNSCLFASIFCLKVFSQNLHLKGFSPVWVISCALTCIFCLNFISQYVHENGFSPVCILIWTFKLFLEICLSQSPHGTFLLVHFSVISSTWGWVSDWLSDWDSDWVSDWIFGIIFTRVSSSLPGEISPLWVLSCFFRSDWYSNFILQSPQDFIPSLASQWFWVFLITEWSCWMLSSTWLLSCIFSSYWYLNFISQWSHCFNPSFTSQWASDLIAVVSSDGLSSISLAWILLSWNTNVWRWRKLFKQNLQVSSSLTSCTMINCFVCSFSTFVLLRCWAWKLLLLSILDTSSLTFSWSIELLISGAACL